MKIIKQKDFYYGNTCGGRSVGLRRPLKFPLSNSPNLVIVLIGITLTSVITFKRYEVGPLYFTCVFFMTLQLVPYFWHCDLWPIFRKLKPRNHIWTVRGRAFIFYMCIPYDKTFQLLPNFWPYDLDCDLWLIFRKLKPRYKTLKRVTHILWICLLLLKILSAYLIYDCFCVARLLPGRHLGITFLCPRKQSFGGI